MAGGFGRWKDEGRDWKTPVTLTAEQKQPLQAPPAAARGRRRGPGQAARLEGAAARRRRPRLARRAVPRRRRRRHARHRRHGRGRRLQPAAPDPPQHRPHRRPQGRLGEEDARRRSTPTSTSSPTTPASSAENIIDIITGYDVIVDGADNFPIRYLLNDASVKLGIPVVHGSIFRFEGMVSVFHPLDGPDLPRHGARAAARRAGAELRRGRRARRAARHRRLDPGAGGDQGAARPRRAADRADPRRSTRPT